MLCLEETRLLWRELNADMKTGVYNLGPVERYAGTALLGSGVGAGVRPTRRTWDFVDSRSWWWTGRPGVLWFMVLQRVGHDWTIEVNWTDNECIRFIFRRENFVVIIRYIKSLVDPKSEVCYYVSFCGMNLILPQEMKLKEGRNCNNSYLVFKYLFSL